MTTPTNPGAVTDLERLILTKLRSGPRYARSFTPAKVVVQRLVDRGLITRIPGQNNTHKNCLEITAAGRRAIGAPPKGFRKLNIQIPEPEND